MPPFKRARRDPATVPGSAHEDVREDLESEPIQDERPANVSQTNSGQAATDSRNEQQETPLARRSWYGGTWPRNPSKSSPIAQVAKESISAGIEASGRAAERAKSVAGSIKTVSRKPSSLYMSPGVSTRSLPVTGDASRINVSMPKLGTTSSEDLMDLDNPQTSKNAQKNVESNDDGLTSIQKAPEGPNTAPDSTYAGSSSWRGWIPGYGWSTAASTASDSLKGTKKEGTGDTGVEEASDTQIEAKDPSGSEHDTSMATDPPNTSDVPTNTPRPRSWFGLWNGEAAAYQKAGVTGQGAEPNGADAQDATDCTSMPQQENHKSADTGKAQKGPEASTPVKDNTNLSGPSTTSPAWSFWYRTANTDTIKDVDEMQASAPIEPGSSQKAGEIVQSDTGAAASLKSLPASRKRERPTSLDLPEGMQEDTITKQSSDGKTSASAAIDILPSNTGEKPSPRRKQQDNLLLPTLKQTLRAADHPGLLSRLAGYFYTSKSATARHVNLVADPPKIKHALAIGVHGYFPAPLLRTVIGQPRGTSIRFATNAADAITEWCQQHGCSPKVDKIALEGEGKIGERVELLWQLLLKHIDKVREADFILVACHSQGVPVAVQLVAKLISFGCLSQTRVGICAMAGINQGPFPEYKSRWIGGSAGELFDFASQNSKVSMDYEVALYTVLKAGIKVVLVGSIDDQLVSMDSATFGNIEHPCLFRAVFINSQIHAPTFIVHLVGFALKLRNLGIPDHGLIRELSNSLAGSFTGDGHSRLYEDPQLYDTTIEFALETTAQPDVALKVRKGMTTASQNPYILPFAMRGVLEEEVVRSELRAEMSELLKQFDEWKPMTKSLKDVKFRLEGVRSKI